MDPKGKKIVGGIVILDEFRYDVETLLTVFKTSLFFAGDGFTVYDCKGQLFFRVDSYGHDSRDQVQLVLMDASGNCLLTVRRKWPSLHQRWEGFLGDKTEGQKPIFSARRSSIVGRSSVMVEVNNKPGEEYQIEGSFPQRSCTIFNSKKEPVAEIRRKVDVSTKVMLGRDAFSLYIRPGFDVAFAMGLIVVLDQIYGEDSSDDLNLSIEASSEASNSNSNSNDFSVIHSKSYSMLHGVSQPPKFKKRSYSFSS